MPDADELPPEWGSFAVYLEYVDSGGALHRVKVLNPDNTTIGATLTTFSDSFTFPADAARLVRFSIAKEGDGTAFADNVSLSADGLTVNAVPAIAGLEPACGPYGTMVTITGTSFGADAGMVLFGEIPGAVQSWTDTSVTATVNAPAMTGRVTLFDANQVENHGVPVFSVLSPYLRAYPLQPHQRVVQGQVAEFVVNGEFHNGFMSAGGVDLSVPELGSGATFVTPPLKESGGGVVAISTAGLSPGIHQWILRASDGVHPPLDFPISLEVVTISNVAFTTRDESFQTVPLANPYNVTAQGRVVVGADFTDNHGGMIMNAAYLATSSNPGVVLVYPDGFGGYNIFAVGNGMANLMFTTPDGYSSNLTINVNFPAGGAITSMSLGSSAMDNSGMFTNTFFAAANSALSSIGFSGSVRSNVNSSWGGGNLSYQSEFIVHPGSAPGVYAFSANTASAESVAVLTVTNAANRGEIRGDVYALNGQFFHGPVGELIFHDATSGQALFTNYLEVGFVGPQYSVSYLPPGDYKLELRVDPYLPFQSVQWFPNAATMAGAQTVTVPAGGVVPDVDFFLNSPISTTLGEALEFCPPDLFSAGYTGLRWSGQQLVSHDGQDAAMTPPVPHNQLVFVEGTVVGPGTLSFYWKVSSEPQWDSLRFETNQNEFARISGEVDWTQVTMDLPAGPITVSWTYLKDSDTSEGQDAAWLDQVMFTPAGASPPVITQHPLSQTVSPGANVTFSVTVTGSDLTYQWQKDTVDLPGQTGMSLILNGVQAGDAGAYRVVVTNDVGSVTSNPANLVVGTPPAITTQPVSQTVGLNGSTMLTVVATGTGLTYQWMLDGEPLAGETGPTLNLNQIVAGAAGAYTVKVTGIGGQFVISDAAVVTVIDLRMYAGITIFGRVGDHYAIEYSNDLGEPINWMPAETIILPASPHRWYDPESPDYPMRYYRAILVQQ